MSTARAAAPLIDQLVLDVNATAAGRQEVLAGLRQAAGLRPDEQVHHLAEWLLAGALTPQLAELRMRYRPAGLVLAMLAGLTDRGVITETEGRYEASSRLRPLLSATLETRAAVAAERWSEHAGHVATLVDSADTIAAAAPLEFVAVAAHRNLPDPADPYLLAHHRLTTLRFLRSHAHAKAWLAYDLTVDQIVAMTGLWNGESIEAGPGLHGLAAMGYAQANPPMLTLRGSATRAEIEEATDVTTQKVFDTLEATAAEEFLAALGQLASQSNASRRDPK